MTSWTDSASGNVFTNVDSESATTAAALYETNYNGSGHAAVRFQDNAFLKSSLTGTTPDTSAMTVFVVGQFTAVSGTDYLVSAQNNTLDSGDNRMRLVANGTTWRTRVGDGANINGGTVDFEQHVFSVVSGQSGSNAVRMDVDGSSVLTGTHGSTANASNLNWLNLGGFDNGDGTGSRDFATGYIAEVRIYDTAMTDLEIAEVYSELNATYAAVPEPSSAALLAVGGLTLILRRKK